MTISVYKDSEQFVTRDYDLSVTSAKELERQLFIQCEVINVVPCSSAVVITKEYTGDCDHVIKRNTDVMSMNDVAIEILKYFHGRKS